MPQGPTGLQAFGSTDVDSLARLVEINVSSHQGKEREVVAHSDISARLELGSNLSNQDVSGNHRFTAKFLDTPPLSIAIATVS